MVLGMVALCQWCGLALTLSIARVIKAVNVQVTAAKGKILNT